MLYIYSGFGIYCREIGEMVDGDTYWGIFDQLYAQAQGWA